MRRVACSLWGVTLLLSASDLRAQAEGVHSQDGLARYNEGLEFHAAGKDEDAYVKFAEAYAALKTPPVLFNLARSEQLTGRLLEANEHFRAYLELPEGPKSSAKTREKAQKFRDELQAKLGHLRIGAREGSLVLLDGKQLLQVVLESVDVLPGIHIVEASLGTDHKTQTVRADPNTVTAVDVRIESAAPPSPIPIAAPVPTRSDSADPLPALSAASPPAAARSSGATRMVVTSALGAGALTGVVLGIVFTSKANSDGNLGQSLVGPCANGNAAACGQSHDAAQNQVSEKNLSTGFFVGGAALAGAAVASWFIFAPNASSNGAAVIVPQLSPTSVGCSVSGRF
jgi:hypothetical protein